ncbi:glycosyltransferase family 4 protein [Xanthomarina sp. F2636L]|uniref:glycosyltransferase family 4 protein n=1 Tax=Xanthomarina sp. F2636L TaxID=2996018 RepID=UPI00225DEAAD|nr:glycosyltransferase family 4 protein [Xanthomarina sp. F2636L]MCX7549760.1 glycosyltransferase family 4 protein [Xanthomarina sp. F2636L]
MTKTKVLIIAYYWPPAGGPGVQRWLKFVKYLPEFGIEPVVYVPSNPSYPIIDETLLEEVSNEITILKQPIKEPYKFAGFLSKSKSKTISKGIIPKDKQQSIIDKLLLFVRGNFFIPDARKSWVRPSFRYLDTYISDYNIETVITTGPPHSLHLIGLKLQKSSGVNWIADFRDPWTTIGYHKQLKLTNYAKQKHKALEKEVLQKANQIIVTSEVTKKEFSNITDKPISVITNGYDRNSVGNPPLDKKFTLAHIGSLLSKRNPEVLWKVLKELLEEHADFAKDLELHFIGSVSADVLETLKLYGLSSYVNKHSYVTHNKAIEFQKKSQVLLLIEIDSDETKCIIPGKLFEYMVSNRPILAIGPKDSDVETILKETNTGSYFNYQDHDAIKRTLLNFYKSYKEGNLKSHAIGLQKYSRQALTESLSKLILWEL